MTKEDKELLLKDLCARLPYGVKSYPIVISKPETIGGYRKVLDDFYVEVVGRWVPISTIKPYLRPMSSMTDEEGEEYRHLLQSIWDKLKDWKCADLIDWLNAHHFDFRGLIPMGLALEAPEGMYN